MKYIRRFNSQEDYEKFIESLTEGQKVLVGGPNSVNIHTGGSKPVPPSPAPQNTILLSVSGTDGGGSITVLLSNGEEQWMEFDSSTTELVFNDDIVSITTVTDLNYASGDGLASIIIPDGVTSIGEYAFYMCPLLTSITIPNSVASIGEYAFQFCSSLTSINIPDGVTFIGGSAFQNCESLTSITIPNSVTSIGEYAFQFCSSLTSINIPSGVASIGGSAFEGCSSLTAITIPNGVTSIKWSTFANCSSLKAITIPNSVTSIDAVAFEGCSSLTDITYAGTMEQWDLVSKGYSWHGEVPATVVHCKDGNINL